MPDPAKHMEFIENQQRASNELLARILPCIPRGWRTAELLLDVGYSKFTSVRSVKHRLVNPATHEEVLDFPEPLFQAATALHIVFTEYDQDWKRCVLKLFFNGAGTMTRSETNFQY
jgi:hypothetical protein